MNTVLLAKVFLGKVVDDPDLCAAQFGSRRAKNVHPRYPAVEPSDDVSWMSLHGFPSTVGVLDGRTSDVKLVEEQFLGKLHAVLSILFRDTEKSNDVILCKDCNCNNVEHKEASSKYYDDIMFAITSAGHTTIKTRNRSNGKHLHLHRPGWKEFASERYDMSRETYALWKHEGSPRQGLLFEMKNRPKARFKGAMRFIRRNEDALRKESLAKKLLCKNDKAFWKEIKLMNNSNLSLPNVVDGIIGSNNIVNMWKSHYEDLFNCLKKDKNVNDLCKTVDYEVDMEVSHSDIIQAIQDLKDSKSCGLDGIYAEHLKHCSNLIIPLLSMCFSSLFVHGCLPEAMISVVLVPIVKKTKVLVYVVKVTIGQHCVQSFRKVNL